MVYRTYPIRIQGTINRYRFYRTPSSFTPNVPFPLCCVRVTQNSFKWELPVRDNRIVKNARYAMSLRSYGGNIVS